MALLAFGGAGEYQAARQLPRVEFHWYLAERGRQRAREEYQALQDRALGQGVQMGFEERGEQSEPAKSWSEPVGFRQRMDDLHRRGWPEEHTEAAIRAKREAQEEAMFDAMWTAVQA